LTKAEKSKADKLKTLRALLKKRDSLKAEKAKQEIPEKAVNVSPPVDEGKKADELQVPGQRPKSLEGLSVGDIFILEADGGLDAEAEKWWRLRKGKILFQRRRDFFLTNPKDSWMR